jgi:thiamine biosynthesis lipoprotein
MATRFELLLWGDCDKTLRAAADEAIAEISLWHRRLSYFERSSDISNINAHASSAPVRLDAELFSLLRKCNDCYELTRGAFDPAIGGLMRAAGFRGDRHDPQALVELVPRSGFGNVKLTASDRTVGFMNHDVRLDLGAIGKGWAIDRAIDVLNDIGVPRAFIHGGTSSAAGFGAPTGSPWIVRVTKEEYGPVIQMYEGAIGVSASHGRIVDGRGHVLNPRTGECVEMDRLCLVAASSATEADALSTGVLVDGIDADWFPDSCAALFRDSTQGDSAWRDRGFPVILTDPGACAPRIAVDRR